MGKFQISLFLLLSFSLVLVEGSIHGSERIVVKNADKDQMQFKTISGNETEGMFQTVRNDSNITMQAANVSMQGFVSQEVKDQQLFKYYNNTFFYVSFRERFLRNKSVKELVKEVVLDELSRFSDQVEVDKIEVNKTY